MSPSQSAMGSKNPLTDSSMFCVMESSDTLATSKTRERRVESGGFAGRCAMGG
ncbi:hypothetical protein SMICM304S_01970 [Streptomyces microflavus]